MAPNALKSLALCTRSPATLRHGRTPRWTHGITVCLWAVMAAGIGAPGGAQGDADRIDPEGTGLNCGIVAVARPHDFPTQPINIIIPRSQSSGALQLTEEVRRNLPLLDGTSGGAAAPEINILFKSDGNLAAALDYFADLPPNGYNIIQLNDTYASLLAQGVIPDAGLVPIAVAQVTFSQIYVRADDPELAADTAQAALRKFVGLGRRDGAPALTIANFDTTEGSLGLEDFLVDAFRDAHDLPEIAPVDPAAGPGGATRWSGEGTADPGFGEAAVQAVAAVIDRFVPEAAAAESAADGPGLRIQGYESASERYFSLFAPPRALLPVSDALIEQPGDVARLIETGLIRPIFTLLPQADVTEALRTDPQLGGTPAFPDDFDHTCPAFYRYRGFFVSREVPEERRRFLEWMLMRTITSETFRAYNATQFLDVLYDNPAIEAAYCSPETARSLFATSVENYRHCHANRPAD